MQRILPGAGIGVGQCAHPVAVQCASRCDEFSTELARNLRQGSPARRGELARDGVGIDHRRAQRRQQAGDGGLAAANTTGQAKSKHRQTVQSPTARSMAAGPTTNAVTPAPAKNGPNGT